LRSTAFPGREGMTFPGGEGERDAEERGTFAGWRG